MNDMEGSQLQKIRCRVCNGVMFTQALLHYTNMPAAAQGFPTLDTLSLDKGADLEVCQCASCGLVQLSNAPVPYYRDVIRAAAFSAEMREFRLEQFYAWASKNDLLGRRVLEIGCGRGEYLSLLAEVGVNAYGLEHADSSVKECQQQGLQVTQGYLGEDFVDLQPTGFDGFMCLNFMEHWPTPSRSLQSLAHHLAEGAVGLVEVPNFDMIIQKGLFSEFIADHLLYFTRDTLILTLQNNGFEVLECTPVWQDYILSAQVRKRVRTDLDFFTRYRTDISAELHQFVSRFPPGKVAVWGAGHQALAVIALAELTEKIVYVVDSAPFKQGKYTPATHLPIVAPTQLLTHPVDAIIVMAASYSDEVARDIRRQHGERMQIAVLRDYGLEHVALEQLGLECEGLEYVGLE